jgi:hypothetical protein
MLLTLRSYYDFSFLMENFSSRLALAASEAEQDAQFNEFLNTLDSDSDRGLWSWIKDKYHAIKNKLG